MSPANPNPIPRRPISGLKRPIEAVSHAKRSRSKIPRRKRIPLLPIVGGPSIPLFYAEDEAESSSSCFHSEISFDSGVGINGIDRVKRPPRASRQLRTKKPIRRFQAEFPSDEFRRITRSYSKQQERLRFAKSEEKERRGVAFVSDLQEGTKRSKAGATDGDLSLETGISEVSQVSEGFPRGNLKQKSISGETIEKAPAISESSCLESVSEAFAGRIPSSAADKGSRVQITHNTAVSGGEPYDLDLNSDLACSEQLSNDDDNGSSEHSTCNEMTVSEYELEIFNRSSEGDFSDYTLSDDFSQSGDDFSERSRENSAPSATYSLFLQLAQQFAQLSSRAGTKAKSRTKGDCSEEFTLMRFDEEEDEESYRRLRSRERNAVVLHDYAEDYSSTTEYGDLILQQRLLMVNWIVEHANAMKLQNETLFLGASLMDRFLSRGYFKSERNLQLLGISCVTLATRIEENQPYNSVRQRSFTVGSNVYSRCEVVGMEWLVLEVVNFQCVLPTIHNFLWFYLKAAKADAEVEQLTRYLAALALLDHERLRFWPSTVAAGLVILACLAANRDSSCQVVMETHVRNKNDDLPECIQSLEWLVKYAC